MKLKNVQEVKKWLRNLEVVKKELQLKIEFYKELEDNFAKAEGLEKYRDEYRERIDKLKNSLDRQEKDIERLFSLLDESERTVLTARYINLIKWDYIEFKVFYSRRQAIRVHDKCLLKLVGQSVGSDEDVQ